MGAFLVHLGWCAFLKAYLAVAKDEPFLPRDPIELQILLDAYLLRKPCTSWAMSSITALIG